MKNLTDNIQFFIVVFGFSWLLYMLMKLKNEYRKEKLKSEMMRRIMFLRTSNFIYHPENSNDDKNSINDEWKIMNEEILNIIDSDKESKILLNEFYKQRNEI